MESLTNESFGGEYLAAFKIKTITGEEFNMCKHTALFVLLSLLCWISASGCRQMEPEETMMVEDITSFDEIKITETGMRYKTEYELTVSDTQAEIAEYSIRYADGEELRELERSAVCGVDEVLAELNDCGFASWDGFMGSHPEDVSDGVMFNLEATVNDGKVIRAEGSENFPDHYTELMAWVRDLLGN